MDFKLCGIIIDAESYGELVKKHGAIDIIIDIGSKSPISDILTVWYDKEKDVNSTLPKLNIYETERHNFRVGRGDNGEPCSAIIKHEYNSL